MGEGGGSNEEDEVLGGGKEGSSKVGVIMGSVSSMGSVGTSGKGIIGLCVVC